MTAAAEMAAIHGAAFAAARAWSEAEIADLLRDDQIRAITRPEGFALLRVLPPEAELLTLAVHPEAQRQGIGQALMGAVLADAQAVGAEAVFLEVDALNHAARALYQRVGFVQTGVRKAYYRHSDGQRSDAIVMSLALAAE